MKPAWLASRARRQDSLRLVMTLLVRNEADVAAGMIRFHLAHGVDFIVAIDNASTDGTREILDAFVQQGVLHLIDEPSRVFEQERWVNRMGRLACERFGADAVFHADADELWLPHSGSLKTELAAWFAPDLLYVPVTNLLLRDRGGEERFPDDMAYAVRQPLRKPLTDVMRDADRHSLLLYRQPDKVLYRTDRGYREVVQGNHHLQERSKCGRIKHSRNIGILHLPVRCRAQFAKKVANNGEGIAAREQVEALPPDKAWHVRRWHRLQQEGQLDAEYRRLVIPDATMKTHLASGQVAPLDERCRQALAVFR